MPGATSKAHVVVRRAAEELQHVHGVEHGVERLAVAVAAAPPARAAALLAPGVLLLQTGRIEHHQPRQLARGAGGDDLAAEAALGEQRQPPAMVEVGMGQEHEVDRRRLEAEGLGIVLGKLAAALEHAAIDEDALAGALDQMARAGDRAVGAVE